jgi:quinoprotein glucose dehydrogenase
MVVTKTLLMYAATGSDENPYLFAVDKATGGTVGKVEVSAHTGYGMMTYLHNGTQYVILQTGPTLTALALADW